MPAERYGELLAKAVEIAHAEGLSAVTLRRVASDLGVTPGLVSHYFLAAEQLIAAASRAAALADLDEARSRVEAATSAGDKMAALMDYLLDDEGDTGSALWLESWTVRRRNAPLAAEAEELTDQWLACIAAIVAAGAESGEFTVPDVEVAARRLLIMIDGLGAQKVVRAVPAAEAQTHRPRVRGLRIGRLGLTSRRKVAPTVACPCEFVSARGRNASGHQPSVSTRSSVST